MTNPPKSRRGVYYDKSKSPYGFTTPYGDNFKFRSKKKLEIYTRDIQKELEKLDKIIEKNDLNDYIPDEIIRLLRRTVYMTFYRKIEG